MTLFACGSVSISTGGDVNCDAGDGEDGADPAAVVGVGDVKPGNCGAPQLHEARIRLIRMRTFRTVEKRSFVISPQKRVSQFIILSEVERIKKDTGRGALKVCQQLHC